MPLFKKNHARGRTAVRNTATPAGAYGTQYPETAYDNNGPMGTNQSTVMQPAAPQPGGYSEPPSTGTNVRSYQEGANGPTGRYDDRADPYANTIGNNEITPVQHFSDGRKPASGSSTSGKVERVVGTMLCSQSLKAKGAQKEQAAQAFQAQRAELTEAERLEKEASARRERAVAHGAHPANIALGGATEAQEFGGNFGQAGATGMGSNAGAPSVSLTRGGAL